MADLHDTWLTRKEFEELTPTQRACISEISVISKSNPETGFEEEHIKVKLYDKHRALENINKMLGYNEADKIQVSGIPDIIFQNVSKKYPDGR
jgi:superfamily II DNA/RNA helicase